MANKSITLGELFNDEDIAKARAIYREAKPGQFKRMVLPLVEAKLAHINQVTGQENDAGYWAYALEYALGLNPDDDPAPGGKAP